MSYKFVYEVKTGNVVHDILNNKKDAMKLAKAKKGRWERCIEQTGCPLLLPESSFDLIHVNDEQNPLRISPYLPLEWETVCEDEKYELKLRQDGVLFLVDNNPRLK